MSGKPQWLTVSPAEAQLSATFALGAPERAAKIGAPPMKLALRVAMAVIAGVVLVLGGWTWGHDLDATSPVYRSATGICLATIMLMQIGNFVGRRSRYGSGLDANLFRNRLTLLGFAFELAFSYCVLYVAPVANVLQTGPVEPWVYGLALLGAPLIFAADYVRKRVILSWGRPQTVSETAPG